MRIIKKDRHLGFDYLILVNPLGFRCGYVRVPQNHPFYECDCFDLNVDVHGGITFARYCSKDDIRGEGFWIGFDCAHAFDEFDRDEMSKKYLNYYKDLNQFSKDISNMIDDALGLSEFDKVNQISSKIRNNGYVEAECKSLAYQCSLVSGTDWVCSNCGETMPTLEKRCLFCGMVRKIS